MSLDKRSIPVQITGGTQRGEDDFATEGNVRVRDARFRLDGQIGKRSGSTTQVGTGLPTLGTTDRNAIVELDGVPFILTNTGSHRRNISTTAWDAMNDAAPRPSRLVTSPLVRTNDTLKRPDCAVIGNILCAVWEDDETSQGFYAFWDVAEDTPRLLAGPKAFVTIASAAPVIDHLRVIAVGATTNTPDRFVVVGRVGAGATSDLRQTRYLLSAGTFTFTSATTLIVVAATAFVTVEPAADAKNYYVAASAGGTARYRLYDPDAVLIASMALTTAANLPTAMVHNAAINKIVGLAPNGFVTHAAADLSGVDSTVTGMTNPASGAYTSFGRAAICLADATGNMWLARSGVNAYSIATPQCTQMNYLEYDFKLPTTDTVPGQYLLAGQAFYTALTGPVFCVADQYCTTTGTVNGLKLAPVGYYMRPKRITGGTGEVPVYTVALIACGRFSQDLFYGFDCDAHLPHVCTDRVTQEVTTSQHRTFMCSTVGAASFASFEGRKIDLVAAAHYLADSARNVSAQGLRLLANGVGSTMTDGMMFAENTPPCPGYVLSDGYDTAVQQAAFAYGVSNPRFIIVWRWIDAKGNVHRGAPSTPVQFSGSAITDGASGFNQPAKLCFAKYAPTGLSGDQFTTPEVEVYLYPDGLADAAYRLIGIVPPKDDTTEEARVFVALLNGTTSVPAAVRHGVNASAGFWSTKTITLYTDSGELASWPAPPLLDVVSTQSRLWGLSAEGQRLDVWYTKPIVEGRAPEWSELLRVLVPQEGGDVVGLAGLDDKVAVLKRRRIFIISGDPGDALGDGSSMQRPRALASDIGCIDVNSIVEGPFGVAFLSERGFYTLSRSLELTFIGKPMIDGFAADWSTVTYPQPVVIASDIVPSESEVRWSVEYSRGSNSRLIAAWNYRLDKWAVQNAYDARSLCVADGVEWRLGYGVTLAADAVRQETPDAWAAGSATAFSVTSPWLKVNGLAGFQRVWRIVVTLRWYTGDVLIRTSVDYKAETETVKSWSESLLNTLVDSTTRRIQLVVNPTVQRCESLRVVIAELAAQATPQGRGFEIVGVQIDCGVKPGSYKKLPTAARG